MKKATVVVKVKPIDSPLHKGWVTSQAYHNGDKLEGIRHSSSSKGWAEHDMDVFKRDEYEKLFPQGYELIFEYD